MSEATQVSTTLNNIGVTMFAVADVEAAIAFYTERLGFELRADQRFGENGENRWVEVAPPGSTARVALNPPMDGEPGGSTIGVESTDVRAEHARLSDLGLEVADLMEAPGAPLMFHVADPDGNNIWVVEAP